MIIIRPSRSQHLFIYITEATRPIDNTVAEHNQSQTQTHAYRKLQIAYKKVKK